MQFLLTNEGDIFLSPPKENRSFNVYNQLLKQFKTQMQFKSL